MNILSFKNFFIFKEAIRLKDVKNKKLFRKKGGAYKVDSLKEIFGKKDRLFYDLELTDNEVGNYNPLITQINELLDKYHNGYRIRNEKEYKSGIIYSASDFEKKQGRKIGRLLSSIKTSESESLLDSFKKDPSRFTKQNNYKVVISRHPYDIAGMSTDRNWRSCMTLGIPNVIYKDNKNKDGINKKYVETDIREGSIIAYLVSSSDVNKNGKIEIHRPLSRILMKPFNNIKDSSDIVYSLGRTYGVGVSKFSDFVKNWLEVNVNKNTSGKSYIMKGDLYADNDTHVNFKVVNRNKSMGNRIFFEELNYKIDNSKYENFFEIINLFENRTNTEIKITFQIPKDVPLDDFYYQNRGSYPKYINDILDLKTLPNGSSMQSVESFLNDHTLVIEYRTSGSHLYYEDEKANNVPLDDDEAYEQWSYTFRDENIRNVDYKSAKDEILKILKNIDIKSLKEEEEIKLINYFNTVFTENNPGLSPNLKQLIKIIDSEYNNYIKNKNYMLSLSDISFEQLSEISKTEEYKKIIKEVYSYMKNYNNLLEKINHLEFMLSDKFPLLKNATKIWNDLIDNRFPVRKNKIPIRLGENIITFVNRLREYNQTHTPEEKDYLQKVLDDQDSACKGRYYLEVA
jgi:hypothetical protein